MAAPLSHAHGPYSPQWALLLHGGLPSPSYAVLQGHCFLNKEIKIDL